MIGRLYLYFEAYFKTFSAPTAETLFLFVLSILAMESADSIRSLYRHFLSKITEKSLNVFYYACSYAKADYSVFMDVTASLALKLIPDRLASQPVFLCVDDTMVSKFGTHFENVSKLFDHAAHNGSSYLNGHCFVSLLICVPVWNNGKISYLSVPLGYRMWQKTESKLSLASAMICQVMGLFRTKKNVIILCDSWYAKKDFLRIVGEYPNLDIICNARCDSVIYDLAPAPTGKKGRPAKHGRRLSIEEDFALSEEKVGDYHIGMRRVLTNLFGTREVMAYVTSTGKGDGLRRLFFSTVFPWQLSFFCAWQEKEPLNRTGSNWMPYIPLFLYSFRWPIEVSYYEQKTFWSLCRYMVRSRKGIEMLVNLINIAYCGMKLLPYQDDTFSMYRNESVQDFRMSLSNRIREQVFFATFVQKLESTIKWQALKNALEKLSFSQWNSMQKL